MLKDTGYFINEDFSDETSKIRKNLFAEMKKKRLEGKFSVVVYDRLITFKIKYFSFIVEFE